MKISIRYQLVIAIAMILTCAVWAQERGKKMTIIAKWSDRIADENLRSAAPKDEYIADEESWKKLWKAWRKDDPPAIDFQKDIVLVATADGPNAVGMSAEKDENGNVQIIGMATMMGGSGFGYGLAQVSREGVKSVNGHALKAPAASQPAVKP